jgi:hypothetical protein
MSGEHIILPRRGRGTTEGGGEARAWMIHLTFLLPCPSTMQSMVPLPVPGRIYCA